MRLFVAVDVSKEVHDYLLQVQNQLPKAQQTLARSFHITLKFLGDVSLETAEDVQARLSRIKFASFSLHLDKLGFFPSAKIPRVVWIGVKPEEQISALQKQVDDLLSEFSKDFDFVPHVTLARIKCADSYRAKIEITPLPFAVNKFVLYESKLLRSGSEYVPIRSFHLSG